MDEQKVSNKERLRQITENIETGIKELFESDKYRQYLSTMSRFHHYSVNNTMLIYMQKPDATLVAGFNKWKNQFERHVKKGEHGITIIAPTPFKKKIEEQKIDPDTKAPVFDRDGKIVIEEKEVEIPMFRPVKVFDLSQTDGKPLPQLASNLSGDVAQFDAFMEALRRTSPVPMAIQPIADGSDGYFSLTDQRIAIREGMSQVQTVSAAVHEIAHSLLHNREQERLAAEAGNETKEPLKPKDRRTEEVEAESISYAVCQYYGIQTGENSFGYIATWSKGKELEELRASLETINKTASGLITEIDRHFKEVCKERGIDLTTEKEPEITPSPTEQETSQLTYYVAECMEFPNLGEHHENLSLEDAIRLYEAIPAERMNGIKGIGFQLKEEGLYDGTEFPILEGHTIDVDIINSIAAFRENPLIQKAVADLIAAMPDAQVIGQVSEATVPQEPQPEERITELLLLVDDSLYLHIQSCDTGYDYTFYDKETMREMDGGQLDAPDMMLSTASLRICELHDVGTQSIQYAPIAMVETLQEAAVKQMEAEATAFQAQADQPPAPTMLPDAPEQALDEYPMPDEALKLADLEACGYLDGDMLPLSKEQAAQLYEKDLTVYAITDGGQAEMLFDREDFEVHADTALFAVFREEWEESPLFHEKIQDRLNRQEEREAAFLSRSEDCFAIYQVRQDDEHGDLKFMNLDWLKRHDLSVEREHYDLIYTGTLPDTSSNNAALEQLYTRFNIDHPADYHSPSMSVSDIVALKRNGAVSCHYCDSVGFVELPAFLSPENHLKNAEMMLEDDYGMIDGIINNGSKQPSVAELEQQARSGRSISLMDLAEATHREQQKKSIVEQLKSQPKQEARKLMQKKATEREI